MPAAISHRNNFLLKLPRVKTPEAMSEAEREAVGEYERAWVEGLAARGAQQASWRHLGRR